MAVSQIVSAMDAKTAWGFYARCWIMSKYGDVSDLMQLIETSVSLWVTQENLSRLVAGMYPRFYGTSESENLKTLCDDLETRGHLACWTFTAS